MHVAQLICCEIFVILINVQFALPSDSYNYILHFPHRSGALFFSIICNIFSAISGMELFVIERILYL